MSNSDGPVNDDACRIRREIEALKNEKSEIDRKISDLEALLRGLKSENEASPSHASFLRRPRTVEALQVFRFGCRRRRFGFSALLYLAACGVGRIGIVDHDVVELNNLHRQVIHTEEYIGRPKVESAAAACLKINSTVQITKHQEALRTTNALEIVSKYDIVIDATDNAPSRYLINDCCVVLGKPLVSGAAIGMEGQLTVYNYKEGPCYRCLFPTPPPTTACQRCSDSGVLGVVPGIIGCLQALEAIKIASSVGEPLSGRMLLLDSLSTKIRIVKIRGRSAHCEVCGGKSVFTPQQFKDIDYEKFTMTPLSVDPVKLNLLTPDFRITANEYKERIVQEEAHVLVDVRPEHHFTIVSLPNALNIPLSTMEQRVERYLQP
ncbi:unnamed protein product [Rhodiola kirilowii]